MAPVRSLSDPVRIGAVTARNRICIPPMVLYGHAGDDGLVTDAHVAHYAGLAGGGAGLIIQEATCVSPEGRIRRDQLGIWSEDHIPGLRRIVEAVHRQGCPIFLQLHHGGVTAIGPEYLCPSSYPWQDRTGREMTEAEIGEMKRVFVQAARRAFLAGYDGVELHGCHSYLLCQFLNRNVNRRQDRYGDGLVLVREILDGIRRETPPEFVVGIRMGGFEPALADGIVHAKALAEMGLEFLDVSYGFNGEMDETAPGNPAFSAPVRAAAAIRGAVEVPVFAVNGIRTPEAAAAILAETGVDLVDVGRSALVDPDWPRKALAGETPGKCLGCGVCQWRIDPERCPGRKLV